MPIRPMTLAGGLVLAAALGLAANAAAASPSRPPHASQQCFLPSDWTDWRSPSPSVIYLRVNVNDIYRLDLSAGSSELQEPDVHLVSRIVGTDWICSPLDLQLEVVDNFGAFREPLIVKSITKLTPAEVAAIPRKFRP